MKNTPVYKQTAAYAREHDELPLYRESRQANIVCKEAIETAIREHYSGNCLDSAAASRQVGEKFSMERIAYVLANTVQEKDWDGRISPANKAWAKTVPVTPDTDAWGQNRNCYFVVDQAHPGLVDLFVTHIRKELAKEQEIPERKPSVLHKLQQRDAVLPPKSSSAKPEEQER